MNSRQRTGQRGETIARDYLDSDGYTVLQTNYRTRFGEIDIVAEKNSVLVFVEVKARSSGRYGAPQESVTPLKQSRLIAAAEEFMQASGITDRAWRIDVIAVQLDRNGTAPRVEHIENAIEL